MFSFLFIYRLFLISFLISLLTHWLFSSAMFSLHTFVLFLFFFLWKKKQVSYCYNFKQFHTVVIRKVLNWVNFSVILCFISTIFIFAVVQSLSHVQLFVTPWTAACQPSLSFTISQSSDSCPLSQWCHPTILSSVVPFSSCLQYFPASGSFLMSWLIFIWLSDLRLRTNRT